MDGCWGPGSEQCLECKHFKYNGTCLLSCDSLNNIYQIDSKECGLCNPECQSSCNAAGADNCNECKNVKDGKYCVPECPESKYAEGGICAVCHETCVGCTGPKNTISDNGCITCEMAIISDSDGAVQRCLKKNESCPGLFVVNK